MYVLHYFMEFVAYMHIYIYKALAKCQFISICFNLYNKAIVNIKH